jgi:hypothetical protein
MAYMHKVGALIVRRAVTTHGVCTHTECTTDRENTRRNKRRLEEIEKKESIFIPPKVFKIITANRSLCLCVIFVIDYIGTNFLTNQPEQRGSPVRRWQITECARGLFQEDTWPVEKNSFV